MSRSTPVWPVVGAAILVAAVIALVLYGRGNEPGTGGGC